MLLCGETELGHNDCMILFLSLQRVPGCSWKGGVLGNISIVEFGIDCLGSFFPVAPVEIYLALFHKGKGAAGTIGMKKGIAAF